MLPVSHLVEVARSLREDHSSPIAEEAGRRWGVTGTRFVRSSASHVFWASDPDGRDVVLRFGPGHAEVRDRVPGQPLDLDDLVPGQVTLWGARLAAFHAEPPRPGLPDWYADRLLPAARSLSLPRVDELVARLDTLGRDAASWGRVHGDPETDNLVWSDETTATFVDLDDEAVSWFGADVCFALRDLAPTATAPDPGDVTVAAFLAGYGEEHDLLVEAWPDFALAHAAVTAARLLPVVAEPVDPGWPEWAPALHARITSMQQDLLGRLT